MNCPIDGRNPEMLVDYAAGTLDSQTTGDLQRHMAGCTACRLMAADQTAVWKALDAWEAPAVPIDFDRSLYRRIDEEGRLSWWGRLTRQFRGMPLRQAVPLTAAAGLLLIAGLLLQHPDPTSRVAGHGEIVRAHQVESALDDLDLLHQFGPPDSAESAHPDAM
jgi:hypothetical protein